MVSKRQPSKQSSSRVWLVLVLLLSGSLLSIGLGIVDRPIRRHGRNVFGNPDMESLLEECSLPGSDAKARLYLGHGHSTVAFWWSVTYQRSETEPERQFLSIYYSGPSIDEIECREEAVVIVTGSASSGGSIQSIPVEQIENELLDEPLGFNRDERASPPLLFQPIRCLLQITSVLLFAASALLIISGRV